jgi:23S rRNA (uracil1939-C5)-methyltransferase
MHVVNTKANDTIHDLDIHVYAGNDHIMEEMEGLQFKIGPKSFFQTNGKQAEELYRVARDFAALTGTETVYDLYTGTGTIALYVAKKAKHVVGIEYVEAAIADAKVNAAN